MEKDNSSNSLDCVDYSRNSILYKMYVSNVGNRLREMDTPSDIDCQRWPWELMQNAKDSISGSDRNLIEIILEIKENYVIFQHDGNPFNGDTYLALLYKYSDGKRDNSESTGRFGTGFLTTHSLSKVVNIQGPIYDQKGNICGFEVTMYRDGKNDKELIEGMNKMEKEKKFWTDKKPKWTKFKYILKTKRNKESCILGVNNFKENIILTMIFNPKFNKIELKEENHDLIFKKCNEEIFNNIKIMTYLICDNITNELKIKYFLYSKINEISKELSDHFNKERYLTIDCAIEIEPIKKEIICNEKSPSIFCSLPLVGSENHILPFFLNSNDFEPSTERQEILLDGAEFKIDEKQNDLKIPTDVGINRYILKRSYELFERIIKYCSENKYNNLHLLTRGLKNIPKVKKYFDEKWYEENYMNEMKNILYKYPLIYDTNNNLSYIKNIFFPIYDSNINDLKIYYELVKELYINVPQYKESIEWSKFLWEKDLSNNRIDIYKLIHKYNESSHENEYNNKFIKFIYDNYKSLLKTEKVLINQENNYIYYSDDFAESIGVPEDIIDCIEELGISWRKKHLSNKITSIELPRKDDYDFAINLIQKSIEKDKDNCYILTKFVLKENIFRENVYFFSKLFFNEEIGDKIIVYNFIEEIWKKSDEFIIKEIISISEKWKKFSKIDISVDDYNKLLNFIYLYNDKTFETKKLLPSIRGDFHIIDDLYYDNNTNIFIKNAVIKYIDKDLNNNLLNHSININNLKIKNFDNNNLIEKIIDYFKSNENKDSKFYISRILLDFIPLEKSNNEQTNSIFKKYKDIRIIYSKITNQELKNEKLETKYDLIWTNIGNIILEKIQDILNGLKIKKVEIESKTNDKTIKKIIFVDIKEVETESKMNDDTKIQSIINIKNLEQEKNYFIDESNYIDLLNEFQGYFDFNKYELIPNAYGFFNKISNLEDYNDIPNDIITGINKSFNKNLKEVSVYPGLHIKGILKKNILDIGKLIVECFQEKKKEEDFNYNKYYDICKIIIKYIPLKINKEYQIRLYNLYKTFDKFIEAPIEIESYDILYTDVNKGIIQYINELISKCKSVKKYNSKYSYDLFKFINDNYDILDPENYSIIPNQSGSLSKITELYKDNRLIPELVEIINKKENIKSKLMDNKIEKFIPKEQKNNEDLKEKINNLIDNNEIDIKEILELVPIKDNEKQLDIRKIYSCLYLKNDKEKYNDNKNKNKDLKIKNVDLEPSFFDKVNKIALDKCIDSLHKKKRLSSIDENEDEALNILDILYKYKQPQVYNELKIVPNQNGNFCKYNELYDENEFNPNFRQILKEDFEYDISNFLIHKKSNLKIIKNFIINEEIIKKVKNSFMEKYKEENKKYSDEHINNCNVKKAKALIRFYPKNEEENKDNIVKKFIKCYKVISGEKINEEEIDTINISLWEKTIKILCVELLKIIHDDHEISKSISRININEENELIENLNLFYSILQIYVKDKKTLDLYNYIPNEKKVYKKLNNVFCNKDIDTEIRNILTYLNENNRYDDILIYYKIELDFKHQQKSLEDIAIEVDKEIKKKFTKIDSLLEIKKNSVVEIDENFKIACKKLIREWFIIHENKRNLFDFVNSHISDICIKILSDKNFQDKINKIFMMYSENIEKYIDECENYYSEINKSQLKCESYKTVKSNNANENANETANSNNNTNTYINNTKICDNKNANSYNDNINNYLDLCLYNNNNHLIDNYNKKENISDIDKNNFIAQAYVYEDLKNSNLFSEINWKNKANDDEDEIEIILMNQNKYKVKKSGFPFDFTVKTFENKLLNINVKNGIDTKNRDLKFIFSLGQLKKLNNEKKNIILAFVKLNYLNKPEIYYAKNSQLTNLI